MNREQRRSLGVTKETADKMKQLEAPCNVMEVLQIAKSVCDDSIEQYHTGLDPVIVSLSVQIDLIKEFLFENNLINEEEYIKRFEEKITDYNKKRSEYIEEFTRKYEESLTPSVDVKSDINVTPIDIDIRKE